jgi:hypothetical protein
MIDTHVVKNQEGRGIYKLRGAANLSTKGLRRQVWSQLVCLKPVLPRLGIATLLLVALASPVGSRSNREKLILAAGPEGGSYLKLGQSIAERLALQGVGAVP